MLPGRAARGHEFRDGRPDREAESAATASGLATTMVVHGGFPMGHARAAYCFPPPQQALYMAPPPLPMPGRRTTGTPRERAQAGRWTHEEHLLFLQGLKVHGKEWKKISKMIPTRSLVQIRSHAQKYFQKLVQAKEHGIMDAADQASMLLMDGKRMTTGGGSKAKKSKKGKDAVKRRAPIIRLEGPCANVFKPLPSGPPASADRSQPMFQPQPFPTHLFELTRHPAQQPQPLPPQHHQHQSLHGGSFTASSATFYCDVATLSDSSGFTTDGDGSASTASGASTPSLHASLSFEHPAPCPSAPSILFAPDEGVAASAPAGGSYSTSSAPSSATTSAVPSERGEAAEEYQDLALDAYDDAGVEKQLAQLETFFTPDELEHFMTGMLSEPAQQSQQQQQQQQQQQPAVVAAALRRPACSSLDTAALFVADHQQQLQQAQQQAQQAAAMGPLPHTPSYSEVVGHQQLALLQPEFPAAESRVEGVYHQPSQVIYSTQQHLFQQQQQAAAQQPPPVPAGWMLGPL